MTEIDVFHVLSASVRRCARSGRRHGAACVVVFLGMVSWPFPTSAAETTPASRAPESYSYIHSLGVKIQTLFQVRHQTRLVVLGDSRALQAVDPRVFYSDTDANTTTPIALNLSTGAIGFDVHEILFDEYVSRLPQLEWVVYQISPRLFNTYYQDTGIKALLDSPGLRYDRENAEQVWGQAPERPFTLRDVPEGRPLLIYRDIRYWDEMCQALAAPAGAAYRRMWELLPPAARDAVRAMSAGERLDRNGRTNLVDGLNAIIATRDFHTPEAFAGMPLPERVDALLRRPRAELAEAEIQKLNRLLLEMLFPIDLRKMHPITLAWGWHDDLRGSTDPGKLDELLKACGRGRYAFDAERWARFQRILGDLARRNVKVLAFIAPMHYGIAQAPCADDDGTTNIAYAALMHSLTELRKAQPNFLFVDLHRNGRNDLTDTDFFNWDHVNHRGAQKVSRALESIRRQVDNQGRIDIEPPHVTAVTAVGDPETVTVAFSEPLEARSAAHPQHYLLHPKHAILDVQLGADGETVMLRVPPLKARRTYTVRVSGVADRAGNVIVDAAIPFSHVPRLEVRGPMKPGYTWDTLQTGKAAYCDDPATITEIPEGLAGLDLLRTPQADCAGTGDTWTRFATNVGTRVFIAHDERIMMKPAWLDTFTWTWDFITIGDRKFRLGWKDFPPGLVTLGGNGGTPAVGGMYLALVQARGSVPTPFGEER